MKRIAVHPRDGWEKTVESQGLTFHSRTAPYWNETAAYGFELSEIETLERAANEVHELCLLAAQHIIDKGMYDKLQIPTHAAELIERSWNNDELHLFGRFDFAYDGTSQPKMLEYNADTPTSLIEASVIQWYWLKDQFPCNDQLNSLHESLIARWKEINPGKMHFTTLSLEEDVMTVEYLRDAAIQAGMDTVQVALEQIGYNGKFVDEYNVPIETLFKLYPWEWMVHEEFGAYLPGTTRFIEPPWKMLWSNKGLLPVLWELAPHHPNLLPSYFAEGKIAGDWVKKPIYSREGANVTIMQDDVLMQTGGEYGDEGYVYQQFAPLRKFDGKTPVLGLWMIGDVCKGMGIRESDTLVTDNLSKFTPHYIE